MARVRVIETVEDAQAEMQRIGCSREGIRCMRDKALHGVLSLNNIDARAANILKQEMLSIGGEAAVASGTVDFTCKSTDVLLMGTVNHYKKLVVRLRRQPFNLKEVAREIAETLRNIHKTYRFPVGKKSLFIGKRTYVMGILNLSPDSFSGDGVTDVDVAVERGKQMVAEGADIIDVGGESTRPYSEPITVEEELSRVMPVLKKLVSEVKVPVSIDSYKPEVVKEALRIGVSMVNDISGLRSKKMRSLVARSNVPVVVMHMRGTPKNMQKNPIYEDLIGELYSFFVQRINLAVSKGIQYIIIDPGIGFGKTTQHNLEIIKRLREFKSLGYPVLVGPSRKSFIGDVLCLPVEERLEGTLGAISLCIANRADIVRVHDVKETRKVCDLVDAIVR